MTTSILIAKILGPLYMLSAFAWLFNRNTYGEIIEEYTQNRALLYVSAILAFLFGAVILTFHNVWSGSWAMIITFLGLLGLVKGVSLIVFPVSTMKLAKWLINHESVMAGTFALVFVLGVVLTWFGYFA